MIMPQKKETLEGNGHSIKHQNLLEHFTGSESENFAEAHRKSLTQHASGTLVMKPDACLYVYI